MNESAKKDKSLKDRINEYCEEQKVYDKNTRMAFLEIKLRFEQIEKHLGLEPPFVPDLPGES